MKILIAIPSNIGRSVLPAPFCTSLAENMLIVARTMGENLDLMINYFGGLRIDAVRIQMVLYAKQHHCDAIIMLDDDMIFPRDAVLSLICHWRDGAQVVSGVYNSKKYPYQAFIMPLDSKGWSGANWLREYKPNEIYHVKTIATGCILIDMDVFNKIDEPWFLLRMDKFGRITYTEDCYFGINCYTNGIPMIVDTAIQCQHLDTVAFPAFFQGPWNTYGVPEKIDEKIMYPRNPTHLPKKPIIMDDVYLPQDERFILVHPKEGYFMSDGIDECEHQHQLRLPINQGQNQLVKCKDCGLVIDITEKIKQLEQISDDSKSPK